MKTGPGLPVAIRQDHLSGVIGTFSTVARALFAATVASAPSGEVATNRSPRLLLSLVPLAGLLATGCSSQVDPSGRFSVDFQTAGTPDPLFSGIQILGLLTVIALAPALLMMVTSFIRIVIVLSFIRTALGVPQLPPNQVILGLSLFLTVFVMAPVWQEANSRGLQPYLRGEATAEQAYQAAAAPVREFMLAQTREKDLALFVQMARLPEPRTADDIPTYTLVPAFVISELKTGFQMGFVIFVPFLIIDLIVSSTLMSLGMMMMPPSVVALPFKILLFVLVDGWNLIARSLILSFQ